MINLEKIAAHPDKLRRMEGRIQERNAGWYKTLWPVMADLSHIPYAIVKSEALSVLAYGGTGFRDSNDIDILVSRSSLMQIDEVFKKHGFKTLLTDEHGNPRELSRAERVMMLNSHQVIPYVFELGDDVKALDVDVNVDIYWGEYTGPRISMDDFLSDTINIELYGQSFKTLSILKTFVGVCLHHYREMNAPYIFKICNPFTTRMFQDIYCLYKRHMEKDLEHLLDYAQKYSIQEYIYFMLYYTSLAFTDKSLSDRVKVFETPEGKEHLNKYGLSDGERKDWRTDFFDRLDAQEIYSTIESDLSVLDKMKIDAVWGML